MEDPYLDEPMIDPSEIPEGSIQHFDEVQKRWVIKRRGVNPYKTWGKDTYLF